MQAAERPTFLPGKVCEALAGIGSGFDKNREFSPASAISLVSDLFDLIERAHFLLSDLRLGLQLDGNTAGTAHCGNEVRGSIRGKDSSSIDNDDLVADHFYLTQNMRGKKDGMGFSKFLYEISNRSNLVGVQAVRRFIKDEQGWVVNESVGQADPLTKPLGKRLYHLSPDLSQTTSLDDLIHAPAKGISP